MWVIGKRWLCNYNLLLHDDGSGKRGAMDDAKSLETMSVKDYRVTLPGAFLSARLYARSVLYQSRRMLSRLCLSQRNRVA